MALRTDLCRIIGPVNTQVGVPPTAQQMINSAETYVGYISTNSNPVYVAPYFDSLYGQQSFYVCRWSYRLSRGYWLFSTFESPTPSSSVTFGYSCSPYVNPLSTKPWDLGGSYPMLCGYFDSAVVPDSSVPDVNFTESTNLVDFANYMYGGSSSYSITYRLTNATTTGPNEAAVGDTVTVPLTFPEGYGVVNPSSDAYVTCNGVLVPSTYSNGQLAFTMPDPS